MPERPDCSHLGFIGSSRIRFDLKEYRQHLQSYIAIVGVPGLSFAPPVPDITEHKMFIEDVAGTPSDQTESLTSR